MKLPDENNLYEFNREVDNLLGFAEMLAAEVDYKDTAPIEFLCDFNLTAIKKIKAIIIHLELVLDEIIKLEDR